MKKLNLLLVMLASFSLVTISSCKKDDPDPIPAKDVTVSVSGGTEVTVTGTDVSKDITVTASEKATKDIVVNITSNAAEGEATITPAQVTIKKGEITATSKITFALDKFTENPDERKITVTIISPTEGVELGTSTTVFTAKGDGGKELIALTITANEEKFNTTAAEVPVTFTFTLATPNATEFPVGVTFGEGTSEAIKTLFAPLTAVKFAANATAPVVVTVKVPKGTDGKLIANFAVEDKAISLKTTTLSVQFINDATPPTFSLVRTTTGDIVVPATGDQTDVFKVTLSKPATEEQIITLTVAPEGGTIEPASVTFAVGDESKDVTITFLSSVFTSDAITKDIVVTGASTALTAGTATITYPVKGTKKEQKIQNLDIGLYPGPRVYVTFRDEQTIKVTYTFGVQKNPGFDQTVMEDFTVTPVITGGTLGVDYKFNDGETADFNIKKGEDWPKKDIIILNAAKGKTISLDFTNAPIKNLRDKKFEISTKAYEKPANPGDYGITFSLEGNGGNMDAMTFEKWMVFKFLGFDDVLAGTPIYFTHKVTLDDETDVTNLCNLDIGSPLNIMARNSGYLKVSKGTDDANIATLKGKKLTVTIFSEDAIIGNNPISFTMAE